MGIRDGGSWAVGNLLNRITSFKTIAFYGLAARWCLWCRAPRALTLSCSSQCWNMGFSLTYSTPFTKVFTFGFSIIHRLLQDLHLGTVLYTVYQSTYIQLQYYTPCIPVFAFRYSNIRRTFHYLHLGKVIFTIYFSIYIQVQ